MELPVNIAPTTVAMHMLGRMRQTHQRRQIAIFTGPPGIGKSTAIAALRAEFPGRVAVVSLPGSKVRATAVLRRTIQAIRAMNGQDPDTYIPTCGMALARELANQLNYWNRHGDAPITVIYDEAQSLARDAIEQMRYYNDAAGYDVQFPVGLIFVGNHELSLRVDDKGQSTISAAVASRARVKFDYGEELRAGRILTGDDFRLVVNAAGIVDRDAVDLIVRYAATLRPRDMRPITLDVIPTALAEAGGASVTADHVRLALTA